MDSPLTSVLFTIRLSFLILLHSLLVNFQQVGLEPWWQRASLYEDVCCWWLTISESLL